MSRFVLDNTVTMAWCFTDEATRFTEALLRRLSNLTGIAIVPALWLYEVVNVTELAVRKGRAGFRCYRGDVLQGPAPYYLRGRPQNVEVSRETTP